MDQTQQRDSKNSTNSFDQPVSETIMVIKPSEDDCVSVGHENSDARICDTALRLSEVAVEESKSKAKEVCVIDIKSGKEGFDEKWVEEKVCRICHLDSDQSAECNTELTSLGCGCKDDLGAAHTLCAEAWFKLKGNRLCEICGETAKNVTGVGDNRFMEEWNENRLAIINANSSTGGCWRSQPFCNFLMACLVIAFVLPWFFRVNMF